MRWSFLRFIACVCYTLIDGFGCWCCAWYAIAGLFGGLLCLLLVCFAVFGTCFGLSLYWFPLVICLRISDLLFVVYLNL